MTGWWELNWGKPLPGLLSDRGSSQNAIQIVQMLGRGRKQSHRPEAGGTRERPQRG